MLRSGSAPPGAEPLRSSERAPDRSLRASSHDPRVPTDGHERSRPRGLAGLAAGGFYLVSSFLYFGLHVIAHPDSRTIGMGTDPYGFVWAFAWWPHAIGHGENPFTTHSIWAPEGLNLAWTTSVPALALLFTPLTVLAGPLVSFNVAALLMPAVAAWAAYVLCQRLTGRFWPSLAGGYLFGFSSYTLGHEQGHLHLTASFTLPLAALSCWATWTRRSARRDSPSASASCSPSSSAPQPRCSSP